MTKNQNCFLIFWSKKAADLFLHHLKEKKNTWRKNHLPTHHNILISQIIRVCFLLFSVLFQVCLQPSEKLSATCFRLHTLIFICYSTGRLTANIFYFFLVTYLLLIILFPSFQVKNKNITKRIVKHKLSLEFMKHMQGRKVARWWIKATLTKLTV